MKKNKNIETIKKSKINILVVLLALIIVISSICLFAWARYQSSLHGSATAQLAKWSIKVNGKTNEDFEINLATTRTGVEQESDVQEGFVGPGTAGAFEIEVDASGTEVSLVYDINIDIDNGNNEKFPKNLIFYSDAEMKNAIYHGDNSLNLNGFIAHNDDNKIKKQTIYWKWDFETGQTQEEKHSNDIADSFWMGKSVSLAINVTGKQVNENPSNNQYAVTFDANGGTLQGYGNSSQMTKYVNYGDKYGELPVPTREGYRFAGWNGKNKLNLANFIADTEFVKVTKDTITILKTNQLVDFKKIDSEFKLNDGAYYAVSADVEGEFSGRIYAFFGRSFYGNNVNIQYSSSDDKGALMIFQNSVHGSTYDVNIYLISESVVISNIQVEEGTKSTAYEPYFVTSTTPVTQGKNHTLTAIWEKNE